MAALRREIYLRKPEVFKMACLRDILGLFNGKENPFYAGFGNRLTDALSYRSVNIPSSRIFTINSNAEVQLDLLSLNKYRSSYVSMRELVDHFFPPVSLLVQAGGEEYTDFTYWRDVPRDLDDISTTDSEGDSQADDEDDADDEDYEPGLSDEEELEDDELGEEDLGASFISQATDPYEEGETQSVASDSEGEIEGEIEDEIEGDLEGGLEGEVDGEVEGELEGEDEEDEKDNVVPNVTVRGKDSTPSTPGR
jgi:phosphatidate phosphatase LPIN